MATLTFSLTSTSTSGFNGSKSYTGTDADVASLIAYFESFYGQPTASLALVAWTNDTVNKLKNLVQSANVAVTAPPPISLT